MVKEFNHIGVNVKDLQKTLAFYSRHFEGTLYSGFPHHCRLCSDWNSDDRVSQPLEPGRKYGIRNCPYRLYGG